VQVLKAGAADLGNLTDLDYRFGGDLKATGAAAICCAALPLLLWYIRYGGTSQGLFFGTLALLMAGALVASKGRTGLIAAVVVVPFTFGVLRRQTLAAVVLTTTAASFLALLVVLNSNTVREQLRVADDNPTSGRTDIWKDVMPKALEKPLAGHGFGTSRFAALHSPSVDWSFDSRSDQETVVHNEYLGLFFELGVVGLAGFCCYLFACASAIMRLFKLPPGPTRDMVLLIAASWLADAAETFSHDPFFTLGNPSAYWFWIKGTALIAGAGILLGARSGSSIKARLQRKPGRRTGPRAANSQNATAPSTPANDARWPLRNVQNQLPTNTQL